MRCNPRGAGSPACSVILFRCYLNDRPFVPVCIRHVRPSRVNMCTGHAGYSDAMALARTEADLAIQALECLPACEERASLQAMVDYVLMRLH